MQGLSDEQLFAFDEEAGAEDGVVQLDDLVGDLNPPQQQVVEHRGGPLLVVAGAGSGKTRVLTRRIAHLLASGDANPWQILAITFTNKAADEMRRRVVELTGPDASRMWVSTFHSACLRILRSHADRLGYKTGFTIYDDTDSRRLIEIIQAEMGMDTKRVPPRSVAATIGQAKAELIDERQFLEESGFGGDPFRRKIADVYLEYQRRLVAANALDFDDLLMQAVVLLKSCGDVLGSYQERFTHILVDEYQDTNRAQNEFVLLLGSTHGNITVVGDSDQSVYKWRGADIRNILEFEDAFDNSTTVLLEQNYRSTQNILDVANAVIENNVSRRSKQLFTDQGAGEPVHLYRAEDEHDEASWVAGAIGRLRGTGISFGDVGVFYRTNAQSRVLEEELVRSGVPYKVIGGTKFYDRREVKDMLAYLRLVANPDDEVSARRIVNVPKRGIGATSVARLAAWAGERHMSFGDALGCAEEAGISGKALRGAQKLHEVIGGLRLAVSSSRPGELIRRVARDTGYEAELQAERTHEAEGRVENLSELAGNADEYESLGEFLETVALVSDSDELGSGEARVSLMTLHTAKGLEFPAVFIVGLEEGLLPTYRALGEPLEMEEERRLCYVGITRARLKLHLSHAWVRTIWGNTSHNIPSRFLSEMPVDLVHNVGVVAFGSASGSGRFAGSYGRSSRTFDDYSVRRLTSTPDNRDVDSSSSSRSSSRSTSMAGADGDDMSGPAFGAGQQIAGTGSQDRVTSGAEDLGLQAGDAVVHDRWGEGVVVSCRGAGEKAEARVRFASVGEKQLLLSAAPLRRG